MALAYRLDAISLGPKNSQFPGPNPLPLALVIDINVCPYAGDIFTIKKGVTLHVLIKNFKIKEDIRQYFGRVGFSHMSN
jgi:hypothetical protein